MKLYKTLGLATAGIAWLATSAIAQRVTTNPNAVPNTISTPTFSPDTLRPSRAQMINDNTAGRDDADRKNRRDRKRAIRRNNRSNENSRMNRNGSTSTNSSSSSQSTNRQDGAYRQGSVSSGTTNNNSNTTNYNSSNVMTAPTGVGTNPSATGAAGDVRPGATAGTGMNSGATTPSGTAVSTSGVTTSPNINQPAATGTGEAVSGASNAPVINPSVQSRSTTLTDFVASQPDYSTLQNALQSAELIQTLKEEQVYTVFAPSNAAFKKLPTATQNVLLNGSNRESLKKLLTYHVIQGTIDGKELTRRVNAGNGTAHLKTLNGGVLTAKVGTDNKVTITDEQGNMARIDTPDQVQTNGVIHGIDNVLMPKSDSVKFR